MTRTASPDRRTLPVRSLLPALLLLLAAALAGGQTIHSEHLFGGLPRGAGADHDLVFRDLYVLQNNPETKFADWVAYRLSPEESWGTLDLERNWRIDPDLDPRDTLDASPDAYAGANAAYGYQRGHLAPLAAFKGSVKASEVNYYSNITPQTGRFNNGPWKDLESAVRRLVLAGEVVTVFTGPYYDPAHPMPPLPNAGVDHTVPSGFWNIVCTGTPENPEISAFLMPHDEFPSEDFRRYLEPVDLIESRTGLDFFSELEPTLETEIEAAADLLPAWR